MKMLETLLEQIKLSAQSIAELQFPPSKIFTNALLGNHEITTLIRDTEPHERALFSLDSNSISSTSRQSRRITTFGGIEDGSYGRKSIYASTEPRKESAVARVLGKDMLLEIQRSSGNVARSKNGAAGGVNVEVLLKGAERLCAVYPVVGASEKIALLRNRYRHIADSVAHHEERVAKQQAKLNKMNKSSEYGYEEQGDEDNIGVAQDDNVVSQAVSEQDIESEEQEIRELEARKRALEERVAGMEKDLGGLLR